MKTTGAFIVLFLVASVLKGQPTRAWMKVGLSSGNQYWSFPDYTKLLTIEERTLRTVDALSAVELHAVEIDIQYDGTGRHARIENDEVVTLSQRNTRTQFNIRSGARIKTDTLPHNSSIMGISPSHKYAAYTWNSNSVSRLMIGDFDLQQIVLDTHVGPSVKTVRVLDNGMAAFIASDSGYVVHPDHIISRAKLPGIRGCRYADALVVDSERTVFAATVDDVTTVSLFDTTKLVVEESLIVFNQLYAQPILARSDNGSLFLQNSENTILRLELDPLRVADTIHLPVDDVRALFRGISNGLITCIGPTKVVSVYSIQDDKELFRSESLVRINSLAAVWSGALFANNYYSNLHRVDLSTGELKRYGGAVACASEMQWSSTDTAVFAADNCVSVFDMHKGQLACQGVGYHYNYGLGYEDVGGFKSVCQYPEYGLNLIAFRRELTQSASSYTFFDLAFLPTNCDSTIRFEGGTSVDLTRGLEYVSADETGNKVAVAINDSTYILKAIPLTKRIEKIRSLPGMRKLVALDYDKGIALSGATGLLIADPYWEFLDRRVTTYRYTEPLIQWDEDHMLVWLDSTEMGLLNLTSAQVLWTVTVPNKIADVELAPDRTWIATLLQDGTRELYAFDNPTSIDDAGQKSDENLTLNVFPNPTRDVLHIQCNSEIEAVEFVDVIGRVYRAQLPSNARENKVDVSGMARGLYVIVVHSAEGLGRNVVTIAD